MRVIAVLPAYNTSRTLVSFLRKLPTGVFDEIILIDDCSTDGTFALAKKQQGISVYQTPRNLGYGGNLKMCLTVALAHGADVIMELHPDGEYATDGIKPALEKVKNRTALVLGNRFSGRHHNIPKGMYISKYLISRLLSFVDNLVLGTNLPDLHQGFRVYTRSLLTKLNWRATSDDYLFSFEIICQTVFAKLPIASVPVTARYTGEKRGAPWSHSIRYTLGTAWVLAKHVLARTGIRGSLFGSPQKDARCPVCKTHALAHKQFRAGSYAVYSCHICRNSFTWPQPRVFRTLYPSEYFQVPGVLGNVKQMLFPLLQQRRVRWVKSYIGMGDVLDVGSGNGSFGRQLGLGFRVTNIDPFYCGEDQSVLRKDFLTWRTSRQYDAVVFWESLEHVADPVSYITRAEKLLRLGGYLFVEHPRWNSLEAVLFTKHWFHLDVPRHLMHFRDRGLTYIVTKQRLTVRRRTGIFALEYNPLGLLFSVVNACGTGRYRNWFLPLGILFLPFSLVEYLAGQAPIGLLIAQKEATMEH